MGGRLIFVKLRCYNQLLIVGVEALFSLGPGVAIISLVYRRWSLWCPTLTVCSLHVVGSILFSTSRGYGSHLVYDHKSSMTPNATLIALHMFMEGISFYL